MADNEPDICKQAAAQSGESDDFVMPEAPPRLPLGRAPISNHPGDSMSEPSSSTCASADDVPTACECPAVSEPASEELSIGPEGPDVPQISEKPAKSAPWSLVVILGCLVIGLLFVIGAQSNEAPPDTTSGSPSSGIADRELASARREAEAMRNKTTQMAQRISELEQQLEAGRDESAAKFAELLREKKTVENNTSDLLAEVDLLKRQLQSPTPKEPPLTAPSKPEPVIPNNGTLYRVTGLAYGDYLNVRSGPGASYSLVIRLQNGVEFSVKGATVTNGADVWLPCFIDKTFTDPSTGLTRSLKQKGWVNSNYVDRVPAQ